MNFQKLVAQMKYIGQRYKAQQYIASLNAWYALPSFKDRPTMKDWLASKRLTNRYYLWYNPKNCK